MNPSVILIILILLFGGAALWLAVVDVRADRRHAQWMERNEAARRRTQVQVDGIARGYRGTGLDGRAAHPGALRKHTRP